MPGRGAEGAPCPWGRVTFNPCPTTESHSQYPTNPGLGLLYWKAISVVDYRLLLPLTIQPIYFFGFANNYDIDMTRTQTNQNNEPSYFGTLKCMVML
jgi:hypothetical protein